MMDACFWLCSPAKVVKESVTNGKSWGFLLKNLKKSLPGYPFCFNLHPKVME